MLEIKMTGQVVEFTVWQRRKTTKIIYVEVAKTIDKTVEENKK